MREIKFRAWHPTSEDMIFFDGKSFGDPFVADHFGQLVSNAHPEGKNLLMQFTGLKDHLGNEIYEGDIVSVATSDYHETTVHEVIYALDRVDFYPAFILRGFESDSNSFSHVFCDGGYSVSVVGNIHENPELLK